jgi:hypothetical protein
MALAPHPPAGADPAEVQGQAPKADSIRLNGENTALTLVPAASSMNAIAKRTAALMASIVHRAGRGQIYRSGPDGGPQGMKFFLPGSGGSPIPIER